MVQIEDVLLPAFWLQYDMMLEEDADPERRAEQIAALRRAEELLRTGATRFLKPAGVAINDADLRKSQLAGRSLAALIKDLEAPPQQDLKIRDLQRLSERVREVLRPAMLEALNGYRDAFLTMVLENQKKSSKLSNRSTEELRSISKQIFLVAINASVEAARLGENGAGFAHISNEIRALSKSAQATIENMSREGL